MRGSLFSATVAIYPGSRLRLGKVHFCPRDPGHQPVGTRPRTDADALIIQRALTSLTPTRPNPATIKNGQPVWHLGAARNGNMPVCVSQEALDPSPW